MDLPAKSNFITKNKGQKPELVFQISVKRIKIPNGKNLTKNSFVFIINQLDQNI